MVMLTKQAALNRTGPNGRKVVYLGSASEEAITGGERYDLTVLEFLRGQGWTTHVFVPPSRLSTPLPVRHAKENFWFKNQVMRIADRRTVVLEDFYLHSRLLLLNLHLRRVKTATTVGIMHHPSYYDLRSPVYSMIDRMLLRFSLSLMDHVVTVSEKSKRELLALGVPSEKIHLIPDGTDAPQLDHAPGAGGQLRALYVGICCARKGVDCLIRAMGLLPDCPLALDVVGDLDFDRDYTRRVTKQVADLGLGERVRFHGRVPQDVLWQYFANADVFVLPSLWEGYGIVLIEAMSFGLPIIATRVGAVPELIAHGENGLLVPAGDAPALASALRQICLDSSLRVSLANGSKARRSGIRSWERVGQEFAAMLDGLCL